MRKTSTNLLRLILLAGLLLVPYSGIADDATSAEGDDGANQGDRVELSLGGWDASVEGSPEQAAEYEPTDGGLELDLEALGLRDWGHFAIAVHSRDSDDYGATLDFDVNRSLRSHTEVTGLVHRLGHDPLENLEAATNHGRVVYHTDLDPLRAYEITYSQLIHRTELQPRRAPALTLGFDYRLQEREGHRQALVVSHCDACHVVSQSRPIDQRTQDAGVDAAVAWAGGSARVSFDHRTFEEDTPFITLLFDDALHPELRVPIFDNRLQWDSAQGPQPVHAIPEIEKNVGKVAFVFDDVGGFVVTLDGVWSTTENETTGLEADYQGATVSAVRVFGDNRLRWRARTLSIESDEAFIDIAEPVAIAGPQAGRTYREIYGFDPDFLRRSSLDRQVLESRLELSHRLGKKAGTVRLAWDFESTDRDFYEVAPGETETTENIVGLSWNARPRKGLRLSGSYRHGAIDHPFALVNGAFSTLVSPSVPNPFAPAGAQYYEFQNARIADTTASPESWDEFKLGLSRIFDDQSLLSASYRHWDGDNDDGDFTNWSKTSQSATVSYFAMPAPTWQWHLAYTWHDSELIFPTFIPIFDG